MQFNFCTFSNKKQLVKSSVFVLYLATKFIAKLCIVTVDLCLSVCLFGGNKRLSPSMAMAWLLGYIFSKVIRSKAERCQLGPSGHQHLRNLRKLMLLSHLFQ